MSSSRPHNEKQPTENLSAFFQRVGELSTSVPEEEWQKLPGDLARNYKHYLYGHPKTDD